MSSVRIPADPTRLEPLDQPVERAFFHGGHAVREVRGDPARDGVYAWPLPE